MGARAQVARRRSGRHGAREWGRKCARALAPVFEYLIFISKVLFLLFEINMFDML